MRASSASPHASFVLICRHPLISSHSKLLVMRNCQLEKFRRGIGSFSPLTLSWLTVWPPNTSITVWSQKIGGHGWLTYLFLCECACVCSKSFSLSSFPVIRFRFLNTSWDLLKSTPWLITRSFHPLTSGESIVTHPT